MYASLKRFIDRVIKIVNYDIIPANGRHQRFVCDLIRYPLLCPLALLLLILAHILLAGGEIVLAVTHHDRAYLFLFAGDFLALCLLSIKAYQRWRRAMNGHSRKRRKHRAHSPITQASKNHREGHPTLNPPKTSPSTKGNQAVL